MPHHVEQRFLPYTPEQIFDVIANVAKYPEFLPWCLGARISKTHDDGFEADLIIGFKMFRETFTSRVTMARPEEIHVEYIRGPMRHLSNDWRLTAHADASQGRGTLVDFTVDFEFKSRILEKLIGALFEEAVHHMIVAFQTRVKDLHGGDASVG